jgi:hypothetical protein
MPQLGGVFMMGFGMMGGMGFIWLLVVVLVLGFAYLIYVSSSKETGNVKQAGQVLAWVIVILVVLLVLFGLIWGGVGGRGMMGRGMM